MKKIFVIVGKSCSGKDTLVEQLTTRFGIPAITSSTSRPPRQGEIPNKHYHFLKKSDMIEKYYNKELIAFTRYEVANKNVWYYGVDKKEIEKHDYSLLILNPEGAEELSKTYGDKVCVIYLDVPLEERFDRFLLREELSQEKILEGFRRFLADEEDFVNVEYNHVLKYTKGIHSCDIVLETVAIIIGEMLKCN